MDSLPRYPRKVQYEKKRIHTSSVRWFGNEITVILFSVNTPREILNLF